ncbi:Hypothetical protein PP7435_CHR2-1176 [Komagataella phaffii CBS 7435]|uniref:NADH dehydrogenase [ubiquinone] 1 alpha subcomplex subunit n=2 Tax=Komagataella phaffii TaxID=460519 RepID=C4QZR3_KOMPG|nr:Hypothetical protein PAS_chr2-1_0131 [Komagataella phaffii GS115]AOA63052.1 GQ67_00160T0 [Komagataella phaffii]KAI0460984.1 hypothetical protein LJB42_001313 [Komagataella kurtzmanii]CAH2448765.1 Hypothetical protein BQ9382_C2-6310 [Komagataella phaffii CBS 7435]AOA67553.1 GQ68_01228T0 [Komagataella phaffii GS115]CAY68737.1 Hypothetical protein PAS_chr2-1_0131 [Komagataella phaffii GS115]
MNKLMDNLVPVWKQYLYTWQSLRNIPFRKKWFIGYDLSGNTYWEFIVERNSKNYRRKMVPYQRKDFMHDYYESVPPQWQQWLRFVKQHPPTLTELIADRQRQEAIKELAKNADRRWQLETQKQEDYDNWKLNKELNRMNVRQTPGGRPPPFSGKSTHSNDDPISSANVKSNR